MSEQAPDRITAGIDIPKTIAGVLATVSAAVLGSYLGVAGTLAGAALASVVGTIGTEVYHRSIRKGARKLQSSFVTAPAAVGTPPVAAAEHEVPSEPEPRVRPAIRWKRVGLLAASVFVLAMGTLTAFELITGKSASEAVGNKSGGPTTIGTLLTGNHRSTSPAPATSGSATPTGTATGEAPAPSATATEPAQTTEPTQPAQTTEPAQTEPTQPAQTEPARTGAPAQEGAPAQDGAPAQGTRQP